MVLAAFLGGGISLRLLHSEERTRAQRPPKAVKTLRVERLSLVNSSGDVQVTLIAGAKGPALTFMDAKGRLRAQLLVSERGPSLYFCDTKGRSRLTLSVDGPGPFSPAPGADIYLSDEKRTRMRLWQGTTSGLGLWDEEGRMRMVMEMNKKGATLMFYDSQSRRLFVAPGDQQPIRKVPTQRSAK